MPMSVGLLTNVSHDNIGYFTDHHLVTLGVHMHVYRYPLFESGMKTGL